MKHYSYIGNLSALKDMVFQGFGVGNKFFIKFGASKFEAYPEDWKEVSEIEQAFYVPKKYANIDSREIATAILSEGDLYSIDGESLKRMDKHSWRYIDGRN